jgi:hypothetical protein
MKSLTRYSVFFALQYMTDYCTNNNNFQFYFPEYRETWSRQWSRATDKKDSPLHQLVNTIAKECNLREFPFFTAYNNNTIYVIKLYTASYIIHRAEFKRRYRSGKRKSTNQTEVFCHKGLHSASTLEYEQSVYCSTEAETKNYTHPLES